VAYQKVSILDKIRKKLATKKGSSEYKLDALKWYQTKIRELGGATRTEILADKSRTKDWFYPGFMYLFVYDPKWKKKLPYYDKFPLVIPVQFYNDGFLGINLHYLNYRMRLELFHELLTQIDKAPNDPRARFKLAYRTLRRYARFKAVRPCLKRYLSSHVQSHAIKIEAPDWETALFLPVENFAKKSKTTVWSISNEKINNPGGGTPTTVRTSVSESVKSTTVRET
jgi:hypothetical protein